MALCNIRLVSSWEERQGRTRGAGQGKARQDQRGRTRHGRAGRGPHLGDGAVAADELRVAGVDVGQLAGDLRGVRASGWRDSRAQGEAGQRGRQCQRGLPQPSAHTLRLRAVLSSQPRGGCKPGPRRRTMLRIICSAGEVPMPMNSSTASDSSDCGWGEGEGEGGGGRSGEVGGCRDAGQVRRSMSSLPPLSTPCRSPPRRSAPPGSGSASLRAPSRSHPHPPHLVVTPWLPLTPRIWKRLTSGGAHWLAMRSSSECTKSLHCDRAAWGEVVHRTGQGVNGELRRHGGQQTAHSQLQQAGARALPGIHARTCSAGGSRRSMARRTSSSKGASGISSEPLMPPLPHGRDGRAEPEQGQHCQVAGLDGAPCQNASSSGSSNGSGGGGGSSASHRSHTCS